MMLCKTNKTHEHCKNNLKFVYITRNAHKSNKNIIANKQFTKPQKIGDSLKGQPHKKSKCIATTTCYWDPENIVN